VVIPAGTGHWFTKIDDHIYYLMVRIDPDMVTPVRDEAESQAYLKRRGDRGGWADGACRPPSGMVP